MNQCASVRKKNASEQCQSRALPGHTLCGRHARMKDPVFWAQIHRSHSPKVARLQAVVRGWLVRKRLALGGPGVLNRKNVANEEELTSCDPKDRVHPFEYFGFEESGKIWWFTFPSIWRWCAQSLNPVNPYTKTPITAATRKRLREMWAYRQRHRLGLPEEGPTFEERLRTRWNILCQLFRDNGFVDTQPETFMRFTKADYLSMFVLLHQDVLVVLRENDPQRAKVLRFCRRSMSVVNALRSPQYILQSVYTVMLLLSFHKEPYSMIFTVLSAFYRC